MTFLWVAMVRGGWCVDMSCLWFGLGVKMKKRGGVYGFALARDGASGVKLICRMTPQPCTCIHHASHPTTTGCPSSSDRYPNTCWNYRLCRGCQSAVLLPKCYQSRITRNRSENLVHYLRYFDVANKPPSRLSSKAFSDLCSANLRPHP